MSNLLNKYKLLLACVMGFITSYAFAPTYYIIILFLSFPILLFLLYNATSYKDSFRIGWCFGFGYFLNGLYWVSYALLIDNIFGWLVPFAIILIPAILALYTGVTTVTLHMVRKSHTIAFTLSFICLWILFEIARTTLFTGLPWLALGYSLSKWPTMIQSASLGGVFLLSFILLCAASIPFVIINSKKNKEQLILPITIALLFITLPIANYIYGTNRLNNATIRFYEQHIRIVQPNISQSLKWNERKQNDNLLKLMYLTNKPSANHNVFIVWPEAAASTFSFNEKGVRNFIKRIIPTDSYLIAGGLRNEKSSQIWNSIFVINHDGDIVNYYDKIHLLPFGEYIPLRQFLPFNINKITYGLSDFTPGTTVKTIKIKNLPSFRPLICYEAFFAHELLNNNNRPDIFINFINDAWFGNSPGPYQHLDMTIFRSVEYGIPMIRAANTGISIVTDPYGRILQRLPLNSEGLIDGKIPFSLATNTIYGIYGNYTLIMFLLVLFGVTLITVQKRY
jgi:apolipoprotein N-acyltransferase